MAVDRANFIPICSFRKEKGLFSYENKPLITPFGGPEWSLHERRRSLCLPSVKALL